METEILEKTLKECAEESKNFWTYERDDGACFLNLPGPPGPDAKIEKRGRISGSSKCAYHLNNRQWAKDNIYNINDGFIERDIINK